MAFIYPTSTGHHHDDVYLKKDDATATPTANKIPIADALGKLDAGWLPTGGGGVTDHGELTGLSDNDHPQYLLTTGKAADSDKLDGLDSTVFLQMPTFSTTTPTITASSGTFTTVSCYARAISIGKLRIFSGLVYITTAGTATGTIRVPIPSGTPASMGGGKWTGSGWASTNKSCFVTLLPTSTYLEILRYDGTTVITSGLAVSFSIMYELA